MPPLRHRAKKFVSSKTAGTKVGRKLILKLLGEDGEVMFNTMKDAAKIHFGQKRGKEMKEDMLKMLLKVELMQQHNQLTAENTESSIEPTHKALFQAQEDFLDPKKKVLRRDAAPLSKALKEMAASWEEIIKPFMKPTNVETFRNLMSSLSDEAFLDAVLNKPEFSDHRSKISEAFSNILAIMYGGGGTSTRKVAPVEAS